MWTLIKWLCFGDDGVFSWRGLWTLLSFIGLMILAAIFGLKPSDWGRDRYRD